MLGWAIPQEQYSWLGAMEGLPRYEPQAKVSKLLTSLGHTGRRVVLGHTLSTQTLTKTDEQRKKILNKFTIVCWATLSPSWAACGLWATSWTPLL